MLLSASGISAASSTFVLVVLLLVVAAVVFTLVLSRRTTAEQDGRTIELANQTATINRLDAEARLKDSEIDKLKLANIELEKRVDLLSSQLSTLQEAVTQAAKVDELRVEMASNFERLFKKLDP